MAVWAELHTIYSPSMPLESGHAFLVAHIPKLDFLVLRAAQKQILMTRVVEKAQRSYGSSVLAEGLLDWVMVKNVWV